MARKRVVEAKEAGGCSVVPRCLTFGGCKTVFPLWVAKVRQFGPEGGVLGGRSSRGAGPAVVSVDSGAEGSASAAAPLLVFDAQ